MRIGDRRLFGGIIVAASIFGSLQAAAMDQRTDQFYWRCSGKDQSAEIGMISCAAYIDGLLDMHSMMIKFAKAQSIFCIPSTGISIDQAMRVFNEWVERNPKEMHRSAQGSVLIALQTAFPCKAP